MFFFFCFSIFQSFFFYLRFTLSSPIFIFFRRSSLFALFFEPIEVRHSRTKKWFMSSLLLLVRVIAGLRWIHRWENGKTNARSNCPIELSSNYNLSVIVFFFFCFNYSACFNYSLFFFLL